MYQYYYMLCQQLRYVNILLYNLHELQNLLHNFRMLPLQSLLMLSVQ